MTVYRKDEVWLADYGGIEPIVIIEVKQGYIKHKYAWESVEDWRKRAKCKLGTVRRFLGMSFGIKSDL